MADRNANSSQDGYRYLILAPDGTLENSVSLPKAVEVAKKHSVKNPGDPVTIYEEHRVVITSQKTEVIER